MIRVLIVDDSAFMRNAIKNMISDDPEIEVVGMAGDGLEAIEKVMSLEPDVVTLDVEMPRMDGIEALRAIMREHPLPVIMVSALTTEGAKVTLEALDMGAVDFIPKNLSELSVDIFRIKSILKQKIKALKGNGMGHTLPHRAEVVMTSRDLHTTPYRINIVAIGASTGGPKALQSIVSQLPGDLPVPVLIAQHMPPSFTGPFAERLNQISDLQVKEAEDGEPVMDGTVYIAPGRGHMMVKRQKLTRVSVTINCDMSEYLFRPSVDALMLSVAEAYPGSALGVILTGLGNDGERGLRQIKDRGGCVIAQSRESCVVYGMPRAVIEKGIADMILDLRQIPDEIAGACKRHTTT